MKNNLLQNDDLESTNYDSSELAKFAALAAQWWDENGELKTLHQLNPLRLQFISEKVSLSGLSVLDVGCGGGILTEALAKEGAIVTGIDMNKSLIDVAKLHLLESGLQISYLQNSIEDFAKENPQKFDVITCLEMLEHVPNPKSIIKTCKLLLKPNGHIFFSTLNRNLKSYVFAIVGAEYILNLLPRNTHDYAKFIQPAELNNWLCEEDIRSQDIIGISYNPFNKTFSLTDDVSINYLLYGVNNNNECI